MPYVEPYMRLTLKTGEKTPVVSGDLTYCFCSLAKDYLEHRGECFQVYSEIIGALEAAKLEIYRRLVAPYEDKKCQENGDVF